MNRKQTAKQHQSITITHGGQSQTLPLKDALASTKRALHQKHYPFVIQAALEILRQQPSSEDARIVLYQALTATNQFLELDRQSSNYLESHPRDLLSLEYKAHALRQLGRDEQAVPLLEKALAQKKPSHDY